VVAVVAVDGFDVTCVTVTVGRNVGSVPMSDSRWLAFIEQTEGVLEAFADTHGVAGDFWLERHIGRGVWDGVAEDSCKVTLNTTDKLLAGLCDFTHGGLVCDCLIDELAWLSAGFKQDAVAVAVGRSSLVRP
jgi:hypothetical protein